MKTMTTRKCLYNEKLSTFLMRQGGGRNQKSRLQGFNWKNLITGQYEHGQGEKGIAMHGEGLGPHQQPEALTHEVESARKSFRVNSRTLWHQLLDGWWCCDRRGKAGSTRTTAGRGWGGHTHLLLSPPAPWSNVADAHLPKTNWKTEGKSILRTGCA